MLLTPNVSSHCMSLKPGILFIPLGRIPRQPHLDIIVPPLLTRNNHLHPADCVHGSGAQDPAQGVPTVGHVLDGVIAVEDERYMALAVAQQRPNRHLLGATGHAGQRRAKGRQWALLLDQLHVYRTPVLQKHERMALLEETYRTCCFGTMVCCEMGDAWASAQPEEVM